MKRKSINIFLLGLIVGQVICFIAFTIGNYFQEKDYPFVYSTSEQLDKYKLLDYILKDVAINKYNLENYNCVQFSKDLVKKLREVGIVSEVIHGDNDWNPFNGGHDFVGVWFEPQTGEIITPAHSYRRK